MITLTDINRYNYLYEYKVRDNKNSLSVIYLVSIFLWICMLVYLIVYIFKIIS